LLAKLLIRQGHEVLCGDRDLFRARAFLGEHSTLVIQRVNARNPCSIVKAAKGCHLLVNACPAVFNKTILRAAIRLRSHYIDTASHLTQSPFRPEQHRFDRLFREKNRLALIHAGAAPGLTNLLAMQAAAGLDTIERVQVRRLLSGSLADCDTPKYSARGSFERHPPHEESDAP
jgi:saccharopine dehydrogenase-like NADP-dependent oxidoreductase